MRLGQGHRAPLTRRAFLLGELRDGCFMSRGCTKISATPLSGMPSDCQHSPEGCCPRTTSAAPKRKGACLPGINTGGTGPQLCCGSGRNGEVRAIEADHSADSDESGVPVAGVVNGTVVDVAGRAELGAGHECRPAGGPVGPTSGRVDECLQTRVPGDPVSDLGQPALGSGGEVMGVFQFGPLPAVQVLTQVPCLSLISGTLRT